MSIYENLSKDIIRGAIEEAKVVSESKSYEVGDTIEIKFNNNRFNVKIKTSGDNDNVDLLSKVDSCVKALNSSDLWNYLYKYHIKLFQDINSDSYFDNKKIKSGSDLKKSIEEIKVIMIRKDCIYIAGEYWCDPEHGFSICFPKGKFIKSKYDTYDYNRDEGKDAKYIPQVTVLGGYDNIY